MVLASVVEAALALPEKERITLLERLLESLEPRADDADEGDFQKELHERSSEIDRGQADLIPWSDLKNEPF